jgi:hypothetical protein
MLFRGELKEDEGRGGVGGQAIAAADHGEDDNDATAPLLCKVGTSSSPPWEDGSTPGGVQRNLSRSSSSGSSSGLEEDVANFMVGGRARHLRSPKGHRQNAFGEGGRTSPRGGAVGGGAGGGGEQKLMATAHRAFLEKRRMQNEQKMMSKLEGREWQGGGAGGGDASIVMRTTSAAGGALSKVRSMERIIEVDDSTTTWKSLSRTNSLDVDTSSRSRRNSHEGE